jgi:hypothetical protein
MKEKLNQIISEVIKPVLKPHGFGKKGLNFYKRIDDLIFLLNIQHSHGNTADQTKFYINCGIHSTDMDRVIGRSELVEPKEYECYYKDRISSIVHAVNDGYLISSNTDLQALNSTIGKDLTAVLSLFDTIRKTSDLTDLMVDKSGLNHYQELVEYFLLTNNQADTKRFVKNLYGTFGQEKRWQIFEDNLSALLIKNQRKETIQDLIDEG